MLLSLWKQLYCRNTWIRVRLTLSLDIALYRTL